MILGFLSGRLGFYEGRRKLNNCSVLKEKHCQTRTPSPVKISFKTKFFLIHTKKIAEKIYHQQACIIKNVKGSSLWKGK